MTFPLRFAAAFAALVVAASPAGAVVAFSGTGQELFDDPATSFPTGSPSVVGSALQLPANVANEILAAYPLAAAGAFAGPDPVVITYSVSLTRLTDDFDPVFLASDGSVAVGGQVGDNPNGSARAIAGTVSATALTVGSDPLIFDNAGFPMIGGSVDAVIEVVARAGDTEVTVSFLGTEATVVSSAILDLDQELSFLVVANSEVSMGESYQLDAATLEIEVPEPARALMLMLGASVLFAARRRG